MASKLYIGRVFTTTLKFARSRFSEERIFIISAKYGLIPTNTIIAPYNLKMGLNEVVNRDMVHSQAQALGILGQDILIIAGEPYRKIISSAFIDSKITNPVEKLRIGYLLQYLQRNTK